MDNNYGYLDQEVEQFAAYVDTLKEARKNDRIGIGCGTALMLVIVGFVAPDAGDRGLRGTYRDHRTAFVTEQTRLPQEKRLRNE